MIDEVWVSDNGMINIQVEDATHSIEPMAISSWSELLGYADPEEALEAILLAAVNRLDTEPEMFTEENNWTEPYMLLQHREKAREAEASKAQQEGTRDDPRSPLLRSTVAAHRAVHVPVDGGECMMDRCRRAARERMSLPEPSKRAGSNSRGKDVAAERRAARAAVRRLGVGPGAKSVAEDVDPDRTKLREAVDLCENQVSPNTGWFLHSLTNNEEDPLAEPEPPLDRDEPLRDVMRKYGSGKAET